MEEALGADGHGFLEQHDALIGLVAEELQGGEAAGRRHVEMLPAAGGHDKAFRCGHVDVLPCGGTRINVGTVNIKVHEPARPGSICPRTDSTRSSAFVSRATSVVVAFAADASGHEDEEDPA